MYYFFASCKGSQRKEEITDTHSLLSPERIVNIAHRGASGYSPEHTITAYVQGEQMQGDYIEIDLQMTKDKTLIAMHDANIDRTTNGKGLVKNLTIDEISQLDAGSWFNEAYPALAQPDYKHERVPSLSDILITLEQMQIIILKQKHRKNTRTWLLNL